MREYKMRPVNTLSIYEGEGVVQTLNRTILLNECLEKEKKGLFNREIVNTQPDEVVTIANLLAAIGNYNNQHGFKENNTAYHAQKMADGIQEQLSRFMTESRKRSKDSVEYNACLNMFKHNCHTIIKDNLRGIYHEPSFMNFIKGCVNAFFKAIGAQPPLKLETTNIANFSMFKIGINGVKDILIAKDEIEDVQNESTLKVS